MSKIRFAVVGCGLIADTHVKALLEIPQVSVAGAWDIDNAHGENFCEKHEISQYLSFDELLEDTSVDAVCICTPSVCHKEQAIAALRSNKHVVLEKPMALSSIDAKEICDVAKQKERLLTVISQNRFSDDVIYVKKLLDEQSFGKLCFCDLYMKYYRSPSYYSESMWRGRLKYEGGGALMNQGIHGIDLIHYLVGEGKLISSKIKTIVHDIEVEDTAIALFEYDCGALGVVEASTCASPGFTRRIEINGENGYVIISDSKIETLCLNGDTIISNSIDPHPSTAASPMLTTHQLHKIQIQNFVHAILGEESLNITPYDGYYAVDLIESIYKCSTDIN